jgi:hypothetical protein
MDEPQVNMDSQDSSRPGLGGNHHLPLYSILCAWPRNQHPNVILSQDSQVGVLKFPQLWFLQLWRPITLCANLRLKWGMKQNCSSRQEISNSMSHTTCTQGNQGDSQLLVVGSQIVNLTPDLSFDYNLCVKFQMGHTSPF